MKKPLNIAIAGLGTVGAQVVKLLDERASLLESRCGRAIKVVAVSARDKTKDRGLSLDQFEWYDDAAVMARNSGSDVIVELIGGPDGIARAICENALTSGRHVVTANKALIAHHGTELALTAEANGVTLAYEAAVAGGVPIIKVMREGLAANTFSRVYGILNGTCNYVLTAMREQEREFDDILGEAQRLGYAEADPAVDVDGIDAAHKLSILASLAFGNVVDFASVHVEGIRHIALTDIRYAEELGYRIKLLGIAAMTDAGLEQRVHPCLVPLSAPIAHIEDVFNAVVVDGDFSDTIMQEGRGAGGEPTASAVVADLIDIARGNKVATFAVPATELKTVPTVPMDTRRGAYYIRLMVVDEPGVFADVAAALRDHHVSMEAILQRARAPGEAVPVVMTIHETVESDMMRALDQIESLGAVVESTCMIRIESF